MAAHYIEDEQIAKDAPASDVEKPEVPKLQKIKHPINVTAVSVTGLFVLGFFTILYFGRSFFLPITLAWVLSWILQPIVRWLRKRHIPEPLGAGLLLFGLVGIVAAGILVLSEPAASWVRSTPDNVEKLQSRLRELRRPAEKITQAAEKMEEITNLGESKETKTPQVALKRPGLMEYAMQNGKGIAFMIVETFVLLYFLLAVGDLFMLKLIQILPRLQDKKRAVEIAHETEDGISKYLFSITLINLIEGTLVGIGMLLAGMPNPLLWGVMAGLLNYIPYLGAITGMGIVALVAFVTFDSLGKALIPPLIYLGVNFADNFMGPLILGRRLVLNHVLVFISLMFWGWMWGILGVLLAVPLLITFKIFCDNIESLKPIGEFISGSRDAKVEG